MELICVVLISNSTVCSDKDKENEDQNKEFWEKFTLPFFFCILPSWYEYRREKIGSGDDTVYLY
jgi:hypothetical protein